MALMFHTIDTLWHTKPNPNLQVKDTYVNQDNAFYFTELIFIFCFFAHFIYPKTTIWHQVQLMALIVITACYFYYRYLLGAKNWINFFGIIWILCSCCLLGFMKLYPTLVKYGCAVVVAEASFYLCIIWAVPLEILSGSNHNKFSSETHISLELE